MTAEQLWQAAFLCVALHDVGKASIPFQNYIRHENGFESHAFLSFFVSDQLFEKNGIPTSNHLDGIESLAVACHHSPLSQDKFKKLYNGRLDNPQILTAVLEQFLEKVVSTNYEIRFGQKLSPKVDIPVTYDEVYKRFDLINIKLRRNVAKREALRLRFAFVKSILHYCDWYASAHIKRVKYSPSHVSDRISRYLSRKEDGFQFSAFQTKLSSLEGNGILTAPTGTGKTEAALLWAENNSEPSKFLYLLPTMTTANKIRDRIRCEVKGNVGLVHGTSDYVLKLEEELDMSGIFRRSLFDKSFITPVTVATVDQLLYMLFNWGRWDLRLINSSNSVIVFDEIHAYEPYTVALILFACQQLSSLGAKFLFMSATLPSFLKTLLTDTLGIPETNVIVDRSYDNRNRVILEFNMENEIESSLEEISQELKNKKKVLVVCNTVAKAKRVFAEFISLADELGFRRNKVMLIHSQFILRDRRVKEEFLENLGSGGIVVATQVVEVGLDIDFNLLYAEAAPIDALIQRMGRVNRRGRRSPERVIIHKPSKESANIYDHTVVGESVKIFIHKSHLQRWTRSTMH